jgi:hypothetical protein
MFIFYMPWYSVKHVCNIPDDGHMRSKNVVEVIYKKSDNVAHKQSTSTTRSCTFKTAHANQIISRCNKLLKYNILMIELRRADPRVRRILPDTENLHCFKINNESEKVSGSNSWFSE